MDDFTIRIMVAVFGQFLRLSTYFRAWNILNQQFIRFTLYALRLTVKRAGHGERLPAGRKDTVTIGTPYA